MPTARQIFAVAIAIGSFVVAYYALPIERETGEYAGLRPPRRSGNPIDYAGSAIFFITGIVFLVRSDLVLLVSTVLLSLISAAMAIDSISKGRAGVKFYAVVDRDESPILFWINAALMLLIIGAALFSATWALIRRH